MHIKHHYQAVLFTQFVEKKTITEAHRLVPIIAYTLEP